MRLDGERQRRLVAGDGGEEETFKSEAPWLFDLAGRRRLTHRLPVVVCSSETRDEDQGRVSDLLCNSPAREEAIGCNHLICIIVQEHVTVMATVGLSERGIKLWKRLINMFNMFTMRNELAPERKETRCQ